MAHLKSEDIIFLRELRDFGVFQDIDFRLINLANGVIFIPCGDGHHFRNLYNYWGEKMMALGFEPIIHILSANGGSTVIPPYSPLNTKNRGENLLEDIGTTYRIKGFPTVISEAHAPCGAAGLKNISLINYLRLHKEADTIIQKTYPGMQAVSIFQICWEDRIDEKAKDLDKIYYFSGSNWREYLRTKKLR